MRAGKDDKFHIWDGPYESWDHACKAANNYKPAGKGGAFTSERWLDRVHNHLVDYRKEFNTYGVALPPRSSNLPAIVGMIKPKNILDFGGSSGWTYEYLKYSGLASSIDSYVIVENADIVELMRESGLHETSVKYSTFNDDIDFCDIVYCNSVLQYFQSNSEFLDLVGRCKPEYILLDDLLAKGDEDFFAIQRYYEVAMPHRFIGLNNLLRNFALAGYQPVFQVPTGCPILGQVMPTPMENFPIDLQIRYSLSILLKRS